MSAQRWRLAQGGRIDRGRLLRFTFDGRAFTGHPGDTVASALLANGERIVGRSFKRHRPRGLLAAGTEEPNALLQIGTEAHHIPCISATQAELYDGMVARSVNTWPSARFDLAGLLDWLAAFMPAGFYYKTFMAPAGAWHHYERLIRHAAGFGRAPRQSDPERYERRHEHFDVVIVGGGPAGLAAAAAAGRTGARVLLVDEQPELGGALLGEARMIAETPAATWIEQTVAELGRMPAVRLLTRTTAFGYHDHNLLALLERVTDHLPPHERPMHVPRQRLWKVRARQVILATGGFERPLLFAHNDRPGVMLAHAAATYVGRFAVRPGARAVVFTNDDSAYRVAERLAHAGIEIAAIVDPRAPIDIRCAVTLPSNIPLLPRSAVIEARGARALREVLVAPLDAAGERLAGKPRSLACDLVCMSGGWNPAVHLFSQSGGRLEFSTESQCFVPGAATQAVSNAGACNGATGTAQCIEQGLRAGRAAIESIARPAPRRVQTVEPAPTADTSAAPIREVPSATAGRRKHKFVDFLNDVSVADLVLASAEGYGAPELAKRYTTAGMGVDQGRTGNINALAVLGAAQQRSAAELGTTTFRPPYIPIAFGALAGRDVGALHDPVRRTPMTEWHESAAAVFEPVGRWRRPMAYPQPGEDLAGAVRRECLAARNAVALCDVSTLGKIELYGPDTVRLLDMLYTNDWDTLKVGRCRYGVMLKDDGMVFDDGTTSRLAEQHFFMTTTSGHADAVGDWIEEWLQCEWPHWRVFAVPVTTQWAAVMVSGPRARDLLQRLGGDIDLGREHCRFMTIHQGHLGGIPCRLLRVSFTGELSFEIYVPADHGLALWEQLMTAGRDLGVTPIGTEALHVLRAEKGFFVVGHDTDATVSALDLGIEWLISRTKPDFLGKRSLERAELVRPDRWQFVGLLCDDPAMLVPEGSPVIEASVDPPPRGAPVAAIGRVTSSYASPTLDRSIALGLVAGGRARYGDRVNIVARGVARAARICAPRFFDPEGTRLHG